MRLPTFEPEDDGSSTRRRPRRLWRPTQIRGGWVIVVGVLAIAVLGAWLLVRRDEGVRLVHTVRVRCPTSAPAGAVCYSDTIENGGTADSVDWSCRITSAHATFADDTTQVSGTNLRRTWSTTLPVIVGDPGVNDPPGIACSSG